MFDNFHYSFAQTQRLSALREAAFVETSGVKSSDKDLDRLSGVINIVDSNAAQVRQ